MKYNLCIPIPIKSTNIKEVKPIVDRVIKSRPNLIELRFDYISDINTLSVNFMRELKNIIQTHAAVIFTFRDSLEGGHLKINQEERRKILKMFIAAKPDYIDIEMNIDKDILDEIINLAYQNDIKIIFSYHNFEKTITFDESIKFIQNFKDKLTRRLSLDSKILEENVYKIIFTAQNFEDNLIPLKICKELSNSNQKIISFCMGPLGVLSRIICVLAGSFLTYVYLEEKTAPGQININKMKDLYNFRLDNL